jgi:hypothetical protein
MKRIDEGTEGEWCDGTQSDMAVPEPWEMMEMAQEELQEVRTLHSLLLQFYQDIDLADVVVFRLLN